MPICVLIDVGPKVAYKNRFWKQSMFDGVELVRKALEESYGKADDGSLKVSMVDASLRWLMRHSLLGKGDGVIMGPSTVQYYGDNLKAMECGEDLHENVVKAFDAAWALSKGDCPKYFR